MKKLILVLVLISSAALGASVDTAPVVTEKASVATDKKVDPKPSRAEREFDKTADEFKRQGNFVIRNIKQTGEEIGKEIDKLAKNAKSGWTTKKPSPKPADQAP